MSNDTRANVGMLFFVFVCIVATILDILFSSVSTFFFIVYVLVYPIMTFVMFAKIPDEYKFGWAHVLWLILDALLILWIILSFTDVDEMALRALLVPHLFGFLLIPKLI